MADDKITMDLENAGKPSIEDRVRAKPTILSQLREEIEKKVERPTIEIKVPERENVSVFPQHYSATIARMASQLW